MSPAPMDDALLGLAFSMKSDPGGYALLIGAGVSTSAGVPSAWGVLEKLIARLAAAQGRPLKPEADPAQWYEQMHGAAPTYQGVLSQIAPSKRQRQTVLNEFFAPPIRDDDQDRGRSVAHYSIARLVANGAIRVILTLNFDTLLEDAIREQGVEPVVVATEADAQGVGPLHTLRCCVVHLHGIYTNPESMLNTFDELDHYSEARTKLLDRILEDYGLVVAGWSATYDPALRKGISAAPPSPLPLNWCEPFTLSNDAQQLLTLRNGQLTHSNANDFFGQLADAVDALALKQSRHPLTVPVAIETAKRELSGRLVAIRLHDTLGREFDLLHRHADFHPDRYETDNFIQVRQRIEEATRVCAALVATLAYWGDPETDAWWLAQIPRFATYARAGGQNRMLGARQVSGTLLIYAAGISAAAAGRYDLLAQLFTLTRQPAYGQYETPREYLAAHLVPGRDCTPEPEELTQILAPILEDALGVGEAAVSDYWQQFEVLRLSALTKMNESFDPVIELYRDVVENGLNSDERSHLRTLATVTPIGRFHVLAQEAYAPDRIWRAPMAEEMQLALTDPESPLATSKLGPGGLDLNPDVLKLVSIAIGAYGQQLEESSHHITGRTEVLGYVSADQYWLDQ